MNNLQKIEISEAIAMLEAATDGLPVGHEIWMLKEKLRALENV